MLTVLPVLAAAVVVIVQPGVGVRLPPLQSSTTFDTRTVANGAGEFVNVQATPTLKRFGIVIAADFSVPVKMRTPSAQHSYTEVYEASGDTDPVAIVSEMVTEVLICTGVGPMRALCTPVAVPVVVATDDSTSGDPADIARRN